MPGRVLPILVTLAAVLILVVSSLFTVGQTELAIRSRFGEILQVDYKPGLHVRMPFVDTVRIFERRIITVNFPAESFLTSEGKILNVDFYVKYRIVDVTSFYRATGGIEESAELRLGEIIKNSIKSVITKLTIQQIVAAERAAVTGNLLSDAGRAVRQLGVELIDVRVRRIDLPDEVTDSVYRRMQQSFAAQAAKLRAEGQASAEAMRADADRQRTEIVATAQREALGIRGDGDAQATDIYARTYSRDPEFYRFYRSLQAYRNSLGRDTDVIVISPDSDFFHYLQKPEGR